MEAEVSKRLAATDKVPVFVIYLYVELEDVFLTNNRVYTVLTH